MISPYPLVTIPGGLRAEDKANEEEEGGHAAQGEVVAPAVIHRVKQAVWKIHRLTWDFRPSGFLFHQKNPPVPWFILYILIEYRIDFTEFYFEVRSTYSENMYA